MWFALFCLGGGILYGYLLTMSKVKEIDEKVFDKIYEDVRDGYNNILDSLKQKTKEDKIQELKTQIEEIENE